MLSDTPKVKAHDFVQTIHKNMKGFTKYKVNGANLACNSQVVAGHPVDAELFNLVRPTKNTPITTLAISNANSIYEKHLGEGEGQNNKGETR